MLVKRVTILAIIFCLAFISAKPGQQAPQTLEPKGMTMDQLHKFTSENKLVLVEFFASWCGPCKIVKPIVDDVKKEMKDSFVLLKMNVDSNPLLRSGYRIDEIPYLMLFKNGTIEWNGIGMTTKEMLFEEMRKEAKP